MTTQTEAERLAHIEARKQTINRAIGFIEGTDPDYVAYTLIGVSVHQHLKDDPAALVRTLREALKDDASTGHRFGAWKASQRICKAAGLGY